MACGTCPGSLGPRGGIHRRRPSPSRGDGGEGRNIVGLQTDIQWCDSTLNLQMGCAGCELWNPVRGVRKCYAGNHTFRMLAKGPVRGWPKAFGQPEVFPRRMDEAEKWTDLTGTKRPDKPWLDDLPRMIFLNDMGDTFTGGLDPNWLAPFLPRMAKTPHVYLILTKRVRLMKEFFDKHPCPPNVGVGTSVTNGSTAVERLTTLGHVAATWHFVSVEPMWDLINLRPYLSWLKWCIFGGESGKEPTPCEVDWLRHEIVDCRAFDVPCFIKQLGGHPIDQRRRLALKDSHGGDWSEWPHGLQVRQMPRAVIPVRPQQELLAV